MGTLHASREREKRVRLAVRVRIYTGLVVMVMHEAIWLVEPMLPLDDLDEQGKTALPIASAASIEACPLPLLST